MVLLALPEKCLDENLRREVLRRSTMFIALTLLRARALQRSAISFAICRYMPLLTERDESRNLKL